MKKILIIATGGTIACKKTAQGLMPMLSSDELLSLVPKIQTFAEVATMQLLNLDSTNMRPKHWIRMMQTIRDNYAIYDGFVICHGNAGSCPHRLHKKRGKNGACTVCCHDSWIHPFGW